MMSKTNLPIHSCENDKNPDIYYKFKINEYEKRFGNFCFGPGTPYPNLEPNPVPAFNTSKYGLLVCLDNTCFYDVYSFLTKAKAIIFCKQIIF